MDEWVGGVGGGRLCRQPKANMLGPLCHFGDPADGHGAHVDQRLFWAFVVVLHSDVSIRQGFAHVENVDFTLETLITR